MAVNTLMDSPPAAAPPVPVFTVRPWWCECTIAEAVDPVRAREWMLAGYAAPSPRLAIRWLAERARHLADHIDPPIEGGWAPAPALRVRRAPERGLDPAAALSAWTADEGEHDQARAAMRDGHFYRFTVADSDQRYSLSVRPLLLTCGFTLHLQPPAPGP
ncbi:hypothetical protein [Streptomyces sp. NPDC017940]|uniref:hypothetical protein n=1 Tax=Streptomyces sp. NPDC017940 TaxID=3365017 RepID=UPI00379397E8